MQAESHPEQQLQLRDLFMNVNELSKQFEDRIWYLLTNHMELASVRFASNVKYKGTNPQWL